MADQPADPLAAFRSPVTFGGKDYAKLWVAYQKDGI